MHGTGNSPGVFRFLHRCACATCDWHCQSPSRSIAEEVHHHLVCHPAYHRCWEVAGHRWRKRKRNVMALPTQRVTTASAPCPTPCTVDAHSADAFRWWRAPAARTCPTRSAAYVVQRWAGRFQLQREEGEGTELMSSYRVDCKEITKSACEF